MIKSGEEIAALFRIAPNATGISEKRTVEDAWACYSNRKNLSAQWNCHVSTLSRGYVWFAELSQERKIN